MVSKQLRKNTCLVADLCAVAHACTAAANACVRHLSVINCKIQHDGKSQKLLSGGYLLQLGIGDACAHASGGVAAWARLAARAELGVLCPERGRCSLSDIGICKDISIQMLPTLPGFSVAYSQTCVCKIIPAARVEASMQFLNPGMGRQTCMAVLGAASHRSMEGEDVIAIRQLGVLVVQLPCVLQGTFSNDVM